MPRVPEMDAPQVGMTSFQSPGASAGGADVFNMPDIAGKQAQQLGGALMSTGAIVRKIADTIQYDLADANAKTWDTELAQADQATVEGYLQLSSKAAVDKRQDIVRDLEKNRTTIAERLGKEKADPLAIQMFQNAANKRFEIATHQVASHYIQQVKIWDNASSVARVSQAANDANRILITNPRAFLEADADGKPTGDYWTYRNTMLTEVNLIADRNGIPKEGPGSELRKQMILETTTKLHVDAVSNLVKQGEKVSGAIELAAQYLDKAVKNNEISADKIDDLANLVKTGGEKDESLRLFLQLKSMPEAAAIKELEKLYTDKKVSASIYDLTRVRIEHNANQVRQDEAVKIQAVIGSSTEWLIQHPGKTVSDLPSNLYNELKRTGHLGSMYNFSKQNRFENNDKAWAKFLSIPPEEIAKMTPEVFYSKYRTQLDDSHLDRGYSYILSAREAANKPGKDPKQVEHLQIVSTGERVKRAAQTANILPWTDKPDDNQSKAFARFEDAIQSKLRVYELNDLGGKRKANDAELTKIIDDVLMDEVKIKKGWFSSDKKMPRAIVDEKDLPDAYVNVGDREIKLQSITPKDVKRYKQQIEERNAARRQQNKPPIPMTQQIFAEMWAAEHP